MKDKIVPGFFAGLLAGIAMNLIDWSGNLLGIYKERLLDWASVAIYSRLSLNIFEAIFAQLIQLFFAGFLGAFFLVILLKLPTKNLLMTGWIYGVLVWFGLYSVSVSLRLPHLHLMEHSFSSVVSHFIAASIYGLVLSLVLNKWIHLE